MESMSHCGSSSVEIQFSTFPLKKKKKKHLPRSRLITHFCGTVVCVTAFLQTPPLNVSGRWRSGRSWQVGWWAGQLLLPAHSPGPLTMIIPNICAFFFCVCLYPSSSLWLHLPLFLHLQTSSPVSQPAGEKSLCLVYWIFHPPGAFWQTLTLLSLCFSLTHSLASVQEAWGRRTGLSGITVQAVWHCHVIPTYLSSTPFSLLSFSMSS